MNTGGALLMSALIAWAVVRAWSRPKKTFLSGFLVKGRDGSIGVKVSSPPKRGKKKGRKR
jgi:hypothetical protein